MVAHNDCKYTHRHIATIPEMKIPASTGEVFINFRAYMAIRRHINAVSK